MKLAICVSFALLLAAAPIALAVGPAEFLDGLVVYHPYDEGKGSVAEDLSGNKHEGVIDNPTWVDGKFGQALEFGGEGSDVFVTVESTPELNVDACTFMAWINAEHWDGVRQIVGKSVHGGCGGRVQYGLFREGGVFKVRLETAGGRADIATDLPDTDEWVHVAFTNDTDKTKIYFDGEEVQEGDTPGELNANEDPWRVGQDCDRANYVFAGIIDEVRLWNRALSEDEIATFMDQGVEALDVEAIGKLSTTWGRLKALR